MSRREKTGNWILDALPDEEFEPLEKGMDRVELVETETLLAPDRPSSWAYFPTSGVISFLRGFNDGAQVEVGVIGREGMVGLHVILEPELEPMRAVVQSRGAAIRMDSGLMASEFRRAGALQRLLLRSVHGLLSQISMTAACNQLHMVDQRLARWLLAMSDRMESDELHLSHEFLAAMLGTGRARVTESIGRCRQRGGISGGRGRIVIADRAVLEEIACECYAEIRKCHEKVVELPPIEGEGGTVAR